VVKEYARALGLGEFEDERGGKLRYWIQTAR
jgi:hypothetical protein